MFSIAFFTTLSLVPFVLGQSDDTQVQIEGIEAHFEQSKLVPDLLQSFDPTAILAVDFEGVGAITPGQGLNQDQVSKAPTVSLTPANSSVTFDGNYTLVMADPAAPGADQTGGATRHWLVNYVTVSDNKIDFANAVSITDYAGPAPPDGTGAHRYTILLFSQPTDFISPADFNPGTPVSTFTLTTYLQDSHMGPVVGGNYFTVEVGSATVSVEATSAVESSTLAPASSSGQSGSGSGSAPAPSESAGGSGDDTDSASHSSLSLATITVGVVGAVLVAFA